MSTHAAVPEISNLLGFEVTQCLVDRALSLRFSRGQQSALLRIERSFRLTLDGEWELDPESDRASLGPSLRLFGRVVESAQLLVTGELELVLSGGAGLLVYRGRNYEAWTLRLPDDILVVSGIDGEISVFRNQL